LEGVFSRIFKKNWKILNAFCWALFAIAITPQITRKKKTGSHPLFSPKTRLEHPIMHTLWRTVVYDDCNSDVCFSSQVSMPSFSFRLSLPSPYIVQFIYIKHTRYLNCIKVTSTHPTNYNVPKLFHTTIMNLKYSPR
jgi:hypothetical protein